MNGNEWMQLDDTDLAIGINLLNSKVVQMQRAKQREKLPEMQKRLHEMRVELKRRQDAEKRAKHNQNKVCDCGANSDNRQPHHDDCGLYQ